jgi:hypothetical protein
MVRVFAERKEIKLGAVAQPLRAALLGNQESLARLADLAHNTA